MYAFKQTNPQARELCTGKCILNRSACVLAIDRISMAEDTKLEVKQAQRAKS